MAPEPIAIVGTGCRFPGGSSSPARLWDLLRNPRNVASRVPKDRFNVEAFYHQNSQQHGATSVAESYFLEEDIRAFDAPFFNISPAEAAAMDPQQRLLLETVYDSLDAGGHRLDAIKGSATGVYCGFLRTDYSQLQFADPDSIPPYTVTGNSPAIMANRISYFFDWTGPSFAVDTGCSSSLLAVHLAVDALRKGDCSMAVAVGSNLILSPNPYIADAKTGMLSATGRSQMWDEAADGYARGEGIASIVLKRFSDAIASGDEIECVIRATGANSDGRTTGITMPNGEAQRRLIESTYASIGLDPKNPDHRCQYFEAHGTGTQAGDPQEASAIHGAFFRCDTTDEHESQFLHVGSIKTVIGHTEATAGLAGLIKASLSLQHGEIAPNLLFSSPNPRVVPYLSRLRVPDECIPWPVLPHGVPRRASVNSFGFGGANVHVILESFARSPCPPRVVNETSPCVLPISLSAASEASLVRVLNGLVRFLEQDPNINLMDLALMLLTRRSSHKYHMSFTATSIEELIVKLRGEIQSVPFGQQSESIRRGLQSHTRSRVLGIFTGQGAQWPQMGLDLIEASPQAQQWMFQMQEALDTLPPQYRPGFNLTAELAAAASASRINEAGISQPLRTAMQVIQVNLFRTLRLDFDTVIGHSSGEIAAAYAAGILDMADTIRVAHLRGWAIQECLNQQPDGSMIAVTLTWKQAEAICKMAQYVDKIQIAAYNSPTSLTLSGDRDAIDELTWLLSSLGHVVRRLHVDTAYHSHHMQLSAETYRRALAACNIHPRRPITPVCWLSTVYPGVDLSLTDEDHAGEYWVSNMLRSVSFSQAVELALEPSRHGYDCAVEVGPHPVLRGPVSQIIEGLPQATVLPYLGLAKRGESGIEAFSASIGELWGILGPGRLNVSKFVQAFHTAASGKTVKGLPRYPFDHSQTCWAESRLSHARLHGQSPANALLGRLLPTSGEGEWRWRNFLRPEELPWLSGYMADGKSMLPSATYVSMLVEACYSVAERSAVQLIEVHDLEITQHVPIPPDHAGLEILFAVEAHPEESHTPGRFICQASVNNELRRVASGRFTTTHGPPDSQVLPSRSSSPRALSPVDVDAFYTHLSELGMKYNGDSKLLSDLSCARDAASATARFPNISTSRPFHIHPSTIDHAIQTLLATSISKHLDVLTESQYRVSLISYLAINPNIQGLESTPTIIDATITRKTPGHITGAAHVFASNGECVLTSEGMNLERTARQSTPPSLFTKTHWIPLEINAAQGGNISCRPGAVSALMRREKLALLYLRDICKAYAPKDRKRLSVAATRFLNWGEHVLAQVKNGMDPVCRPKWLEGSVENACTPELGPLAGAAEDLKNQLASEGGSDIQDSAHVDRLITADLDDIAPWYDRFASLVGHLTALSPEMDILEVTGSGTNHLTTRVLKETEALYKTYTRAVINKPAGEANVKDGENVEIQTLDFDLIEQSIQPASMDLVIVHQALYSSASPSGNLTKLHRLLKPGGYILILEDTNPHLIHRKLILPLSAWRDIDQEHLPHGPVRTRETWKELLVSHGFTGIDSITPIHDEVMSGLSIMVSQAVEPTDSIMRSPFAPAKQHPDLVIAAARSAWMDRTWIAVHECFRRMELAEDISHIDFTTLNPGTVVLVVTDPSIAGSCASARDQQAVMQNMFTSASKILWVSTDSAAPSTRAAVTSGLLKGLSLEHPDTICQQLSLPTTMACKNNVQLVTTHLMRLVHTTVPGKKSGLMSARPLEIELKLSAKGILQVPRHTYSRQMNQRRLAAHVKMEDQIFLYGDSEYPLIQLKHVGTAQKPKALLHAYQRARPLHNLSLPTFEIKVHCSTAKAIKIGEFSFFHIIIGTVIGRDNRHSPGRRVVALCEHNARRVRAPPSLCWDIPSSVSPTQECDFLATTVGVLFAKKILSQVEDETAILVLEPHATALHALKSLARFQNTEILAVTFDATGKSKTTGMIQINKHTSAHRVRQMLPSSRVGVIVAGHADKHVESRISNLFPDARHLNMSSFYQTSATPRSKSHHSVPSFSAALERVVGCFHTQSHSSSIRTVPDVLSGKHELGPTTVVNWLCDDGAPVRVQIRLASDGVCLSEDSTYVLWELSETQRKVVMDWLISHGARHLVLVGSSCKDEQWISELSSDGVEVINILPEQDPSHTLLALHTQPLLPPIRGVVFSSELNSTSTADSALEEKIGAIATLSQHCESLDLEFFLGIDQQPVTQDARRYAMTEYLTVTACQRTTSGFPGSAMCLGPGIDLATIDRDDVAEIFAEAVLAGDPTTRRDRVVAAGLCPHTSKPYYSQWEAMQSRNPAMSGVLALSRQAQKEDVVARTDPEDIPFSAQLECAKASSNAAVEGVIRKHFMKYLQDRLHLSSAITQDTTFSELGVDSIVAAQLGGWFSREVGVKISVVGILAGASCIELPRSLQSSRGMIGTCAEQLEFKTTCSDVREKIQIQVTMKPNIPATYSTLQLPDIRVSHVPASSPIPTPVILVHLDRPRHKNAFTLSMQQSLIELYSYFNVDGRVKAIVLTGSGSAFCAGMDLAIGFGEGGKASDQLSFGKTQRDMDHRDSGGQLALAIHHCSKPTVVAINGSAVGIGVTMTLPATIRVACSQAKIGFVFSRRGLTMEACSAWFLPRLIGLSKATHLVTTGALYSPNDAILNGLFSEILPTPEATLERALSIAEDIAKNTSVVSTKLMRDMMCYGPGSPDEMHLLDSKVINSRYGSKDNLEGVRSFFEKRPPAFTDTMCEHRPGFYPWWRPVDVRDPSKL
ncbi:ketoacyl-synt-domain-containing protein [Aspergillus karnatakaensis]|uniref:ketoacyl-synt-domain-containing protein n=1 Tax=Aspergillus karnatakaensis TaxID=1810916 RepID=UPI003CCD49E7